MNEEVYIVCASQGEYSDRSEWICGVYFSEAEAKRLVEEHTAKAATDRVVYDAYCERKRREIPINFSMSWEAERAALDAYDRENPPPDGPEADSFWVVKVLIGKWGCYDGLDIASQT